MQEGRARPLKGVIRRGMRKTDSEDEEKTGGELGKFRHVHGCKRKYHTCVG